ncbi:hypothetical protein QYE76_068677 [Lolium multiflorum]|uniref:Uncharacterized protein n=1 Tax=Lolium multiflorum TaxID=4521 RepID=A0AAD8SEW9_LOLMU|nr:hypothetical protein QYE76_068677 [Lolium multiflorum]
MRTKSPPPAAPSPRALRGFLGLAGYYRRYIRDFGLIAAPLTFLLRRAPSHRTRRRPRPRRLRRALTTGPVLRMPDFDEPFVVAARLAASAGAVLHRARATRFLRPPRAHHSSPHMSAADRAVRRCASGRIFGAEPSSSASTSPSSTPRPPQHVADALSRRDIDDVVDAPTVGAALCIHSGPSFAFIDEVRRATAEAVDAQQLRRRLAAASWARHGAWTRDYSSMGATSSCRIMETAPRGLVLGAFYRSRGRPEDPSVSADFYIPRDGVLVRDWVRACVTCQWNKTETLRPAGLLQTLDVPSQVWADISMDFIEGLPKVSGKSVILTVVDRFSKYAHFIALGHPYTAASVARAATVSLPVDDTSEEGSSRGEETTRKLHEDLRVHVLEQITEIEGLRQNAENGQQAIRLLESRLQEETAKRSKFDELSAKVQVLEAENESLKEFVKNSASQENQARKELIEKHARDLAELNEKLEKSQGRVISVISKNRVLEAEAEAIDKLIFPSLGFEWSKESNLKRTEAYDEARISIDALFEACRGIAKTLSLKKAKTTLIDTMTKLMQQVPDFIRARSLRHGAAS